MLLNLLPSNMNLYHFLDFVTIDLGRLAVVSYLVIWIARPSSSNFDYFVFSVVKKIWVECKAKKLCMVEYAKIFYFSKSLP